MDLCADEGDRTNTTLASKPILSENQTRCPHHSCTVLSDVCKVGSGLGLCKTVAFRDRPRVRVHILRDVCLDLDMACRLGGDNSTTGEVGEGLS